MKKSNSKQFSSANPGFIIFVLDQSGSMSESYPEGGSKAAFLHKVVNRTINEMINSNMDGETVKDRAIISLFGCGGKGAVEIRTDKLSGFANNPLRIESATQKVSDGNGGLVEVSTQNPIFFDEQASGPTPLGSTLEVVKQVTAAFMEKYPDSPAPVIVVVSDGMPYAEGLDEEAKAISEANEIMNLQGDDGSPLIFNCHIGNGVNKCTFPSSEEELNDEQSRFLYKISSEVPESYKEAAAKLELSLSDNCKGMVSNADPTTLIKFINFGSSGASQDRMSNN